MLVDALQAQLEGRDDRRRVDRPGQRLGEAGIDRRGRDQVELGGRALLVALETVGKAGVEAKLVIVEIVGQGRPLPHLRAGGPLAG
jgi:hypothetical protein